MSLSAELDAALDATADCEQALRSAGLVHAAAHARAACASLRVAIASILRESCPAYAADGGSGGFELILEDGRHTGWALAPCCGGTARRVRLGITPPAPTAIAVHDLGWELVSSDEARAFAADDIDAALLQAAIHSTGWIAVGRAARWSTSRTGAATIVRLLRDGRPASTLAGGAALPLEARVLAAMAALGWRPERHTYSTS